MEKINVANYGVAFRCANSKINVYLIISWNESQFYAFKTV